MPELIDGTVIIQSILERDKVIETVTKIMDEYINSSKTFPEELLNIKSRLLVNIENILGYYVPTIEPEVRHGRWKKKNGEIYCTNCKKSKWSESFELMLRGFDFCPKCGADMREEGANNG